MIPHRTAIGPAIAVHRMRERRSPWSERLRFAVDAGTGIVRVPRTERSEQGGCARVRRARSGWSA